MADDERGRIPGLCSVETEGPSTMLFSLVEGGDTEGSVIRRAYRSRMAGNAD